MDKTMNYLSLARKAGKAELGEEPVGAAARSGKAYLILAAGNCSDHTWRRAKSYAAGTSQQCVRLPHSKDDMGMATGRQELSLAAITDAALALALLQSLPEQAKYAEAMQALTEKTQRLAQRKKEAQAHKKNVAKGKK